MMNISTYNCVIIDDEYFARELLADYLKEYPQFVLLGKYKNTSLAKNILLSQTVIDVIFLDIQMPNETGIEFLKNNKIESKVIFTTAYSEYALESYNLEIIDYLLKPISQERFQRAIVKLQNQLDIEKKVKSFQVLENYNNDYIIIKSGAEAYKIYFNDLIRLQADGEYVKYVTTSKDYFILGSLKKISSQLSDLFMQVHRSHIISFAHIKGRERYTLILKDEFQIPIGKTYRTKVLEELKRQGF